MATSPRQYDCEPVPDHWILFSAETSAVGLSVDWDSVVSIIRLAASLPRFFAPTTNRISQHPRCRISRLHTFICIFLRKWAYPLRGPNSIPIPVQFFVFFVPFVSTANREMAYFNNTSNFPAADGVGVDRTIPGGIYRFHLSFPLRTVGIHR